MAHIESQSQHASHKIKSFVVPSGSELVLYTLLSIIVLAILNYGSIISRLGDNDISLPQHLHASLNALSSNFSNSMSSSFGGRLGQVLVWSLVGAAAYVLLWLVKNILNSFENDIITTSYLHPSTFSSAGYWGSSLSVKIFLFASVVLTVVYTYLLVRVILPTIAAQAGGAVYNFQAATSPAYLILCIVAGAVLLYLITVLLRIIVRLWKLL